MLPLVSQTLCPIGPVGGVYFEILSCNWLNALTHAIRPCLIGCLPAGIFVLHANAAEDLASVVMAVGMACTRVVVACTRVVVACTRVVVACTKG